MTNLVGCGKHSLVEAPSFYQSNVVPGWCSNVFLGGADSLNISKAWKNSNEDPTEHAWQSATSIIRDGLVLGVNTLSSQCLDNATGYA